MKKTFFYYSLVFMIALAGCSKDPSLIGDYEIPDFLREDELAIVDALPLASGFDASTVVLPNGVLLEDFALEMDSQFYSDWFRSSGPFDDLGPQDARNLLIMRLTSVALNLTDRSRHVYNSEGANAPAQNGIGYSWGGKDHTARRTPPGAGSACTDRIYGLDCSGFIYQLFKGSGVTGFPSGNANRQRLPETIQAKIEAAFPSFHKVKVDDLGQISYNNFETGDIIYWKRSNGSAFHIGIVLENSAGGLAVYMSSGRQGVNEEQCNGNIGPRRGPIQVQLSDPYWFGSSKPFGVVRINAEISGDWDFKLRCDGQTETALELDLEFPTGETNSFDISKPFIDYDGSSNNADFEFTYDKETNFLDCDFIITDSDIPDFERKDRFSVKMERDEIDFFDCIQLYINGGSGCVVEVSLINQE